MGRRARGDGIVARAAIVDIASALAVADAFAALGEIDILINNAGVTSRHALATTDPAAWRDESMPISTAPFYCCQAVATTDGRPPGWRDCEVGSVNGLHALGDPAYSAGKAGMISLTKSLAMEYGRHNIRANIVLPGTVRTRCGTSAAARTSKSSRR